MHRFRKLAVALQQAPEDAALIRYAAQVAALGTAESLRFVHVAQLASKTLDEPAKLAAQRSLQTTVDSSLPGGTQNLDVGHDVLAGPLTDELLRYVADQKIDLVLVGRARKDGGRQSLARRLAMKAPCSVWMVPESATAPIRRILVPIDFSDHAEDTLRVAVSLARLCGAECLPLHVYFNEAVITYEGYDQVLRGEEEAAYRKFVAPIDVSGVEMKPIFEEGPNAPHTIERVAQQVGADLLVMGTRGRSRSAAILLGSVTEETMLSTRLPLLAVKHFGAWMNVVQALLDPRFRKGGRLHTD